MALTVIDGILKIDGEPLNHLGVNAAYLLARRWYVASDTQYIETLDYLAEMGIKVIRCVAIPNAAGTGGGLTTWGTSTGLTTDFYSAQDVIFDYAASKGIQIIPTLFSNYWSIANYKSEKLNQLGVTASAMQTYMRTCANEYVTHYLNHAAIAGWEISNEWNNYAELQAYPTGNDYTGSAYSADSNNLISISGLVSAFTNIALEIRSVDSSRIILSGNAGPWNTTKLALDGYEGYLDKLNPDPINTISLHLYSYPTNNVWCRNGYEPINDIVGAAKRVGRNLKKPVILGECGVFETLPTASKDYTLMFNHLQSTSAAPLSLLWNFYKPGSTNPASNDGYDFYVTGNRTKYISDIVRTNEINNQKTQEKFSGAIPTKYLTFTGTEAAYTAMPTINGQFSVSFWARHNGAINKNYPRIISATSDESTNGFIISELGTTDYSFGEPYFRIFNGSGQSTTLRTGSIQQIRWKHFCYCYSNYETTFTTNLSTNELNLDTTISNIKTGDLVRLTTTGTLPGGLAINTDYYVIKMTDKSIKLATGQGNSYLGLVIDITSNGSGIHTITSNFVSIYQNGLKSTGDNSTIFTGTWVSPVGDFVIGANRNKNADFYRGDIAKVRLWNRGLTEGEVWQDFIGNTPNNDISFLVNDTSNLTLVGSPVFTTNYSRSTENRTTTTRSIVSRSIRQ